MSPIAPGRHHDDSPRIEWQGSADMFVLRVGDYGGAEGWVMRRCNLLQIPVDSDASRE
jgi:hypothetical protein